MCVSKENKRKVPEREHDLSEHVDNIGSFVIISSGKNEFSYFQFQIGLHRCSRRAVNKLFRTNINKENVYKNVNKNDLSSSLSDECPVS